MAYTVTLDGKPKEVEYKGMVAVTFREQEPAFCDPSEPGSRPYHFFEISDPNDPFSMFGLVNIFESPMRVFFDGNRIVCHGFAPTESQESRIKEICKKMTECSSH